MLEVHIIKLSWPGERCCNENCRHLPEYVDHTIDDDYFIKQGSICATVTLFGLKDRGIRHSYCRDCIDTVYQQIKSKMDTKLWAFH